MDNPIADRLPMHKKPAPLGQWGAEKIKSIIGLTGPYG
jgi:hypothetical protein